MMDMKSSYLGLVLIAAVVGPVTFGCSGKEEATTPVEFCSTLNLYGLELTQESPPSDVAEVALAAVENDDLDTLVKLVAAKKVSADVQRITQGNQAFRISVDQAPQMTAQVIAEKIHQLTPDSRTIGEETIRGNQASVVVMGIQAGQVGQVILHFTRENDLWKLVPSHRGGRSD
jgi:hypothetical protein